MIDIDEILAGARLPERTVRICLRGDLQAELERVEAEEQDMAPSLAGSAAPRIRAAMADATITITLRALPRREWTQLVAQYPPRRDVAGDQTLGVDEQEFFPPLLRRSVVDPQLTSEQWDHLEQALTSRQWDHLVTAAWRLNRGDIVPLP